MELSDKQIHSMCKYLKGKCWECTRDSWVVDDTGEPCTALCFLLAEECIEKAESIINEAKP